MSGLAALKGGGAESGLSAIKQYRNSEVGLIPAEWELRSVGRFAAIKTGPFGTLLKASEYASGDGVPLISVGEIRDGFLKVLEHTPRVEPIVTRRLPEYLLREGDIIFGRKGGVDRSAIVLAHQDGWFLGSDGISVRPGSDCHSPYIAFQFQSSRIKKWLLQNAIGTTMPSLNQDVLGKVIVPFPPTLAEQHAIAEALSDADALIEGLSSLIAKKRAIKQGAMQDLLTGKRRLPGFEGEWRNETVAALEGAKQIKLSRGQVISKADISNTPGDNPIYSSSVHNDGLFGSYGRFMFNEELITWSIDGGGNFFYRRKHKFSVTNVCGYMRVDKAHLSCQFLAFALQLQHRAKVFDYQSKAHPSIVRKDYAVDLPPLDEQTAIAAVLSDMDAEIEALNGKLAKARAVKQGMMQELLTGRVRLV